MKLNYGEALREGFAYVLRTNPKVFAIGQGLWSPWYVGNSMRDLDREFGAARVIDTPVSEAGTTGVAVGASLCGYRPIVIHPRIDFLILAVDQIVNQAAKWAHMIGGSTRPGVTIRGIVNRGGEQGAQHSQALHSWFAHVPGLRVVMPATVRDARDLLIASVLSEDPVLFIDDRWLYDQTDDLPPVKEIALAGVRPQLIREGKDVTLVGVSHTTLICSNAAALLAKQGVSCDVVDLRILNPLSTELVSASVEKTGRLCVVDGAWKTCGLGGEIIARVCEGMQPGRMKASPVRLTLPDAPAPTSKALEDIYYIKPEHVVSKVMSMFAG